MMSRISENILKQTDIKGNFSHLSQENNWVFRPTNKQYSGAMLFQPLARRRTTIQGLSIVIYNIIRKVFTALESFFADKQFMVCLDIGQVNRKVAFLSTDAVDG